MYIHMFMYVHIQIHVRVLAIDIYFIFMYVCMCFSGLEHCGLPSSVWLYLVLYRLAVAPGNAFKRRLWSSQWIVINWFGIPAFHH